MSKCYNPEDIKAIGFEALIFPSVYDFETDKTFFDDNEFYAISVNAYSNGNHDFRAWTKFNNKVENELIGLEWAKAMLYIVTEMENGYIEDEYIYTVELNEEGELKTYREE